MLHMVTLIIPKLEVTDAFIAKMEKDLKHTGLVGVVFCEEDNSYTVTIYSEYDRARMKMIVYRYYSYAGYSIDIMQDTLPYFGPIDTVYITGYDDHDDL